MYLLSGENITCGYSSIDILSNCTIGVKRGQIASIVGPNGAGKSTLIKCLSGAYRQDSGDVYVKGEKVNIQTPRDARDYNIETIYQTLALADNLDAASNLFLGRELTTSLGFVDDSAMEAETRKIMGRLTPISASSHHRSRRCRAGSANPSPSHGPSISKPRS